jgi:hypothetical protein
LIILVAGWISLEPGSNFIRRLCVILSTTEQAKINNGSQDDGVCYGADGEHRNHLSFFACCDQTDGVFAVLLLSTMMQRRMSPQQVRQACNAAAAATAVAMYQHQAGG